MSKPLSELTQESNNRGTWLRGPDGRFKKSPRTFTIHDSDSESEVSKPETLAVSTPKNSGTLGRLKLISNRQNSDSNGRSPRTSQSQAITGPLTKVAENKTNEDVHRATEDSIRGNNGKVFQNTIEILKREEEEEEKEIGKLDKNSDQELLSNLS